MMRSNLAYPKLFTVILLVLSIGCISGEAPQVGNAKGLGISYFKPDIDRVSEGGRIVLAMLVYNGGSFAATNIEANLYLHGGFEGAEWVRSISKLDPVDRELGSSGESQEILWDMTAPTLTSGESTYPFNFKASIGFDYSSSTSREIPILTYDRILEIKQSGRGIPVGTSTSLDGPVSLRIASDEPVVRQDKDDFKEFEIKLILTNIGNGYVKHSGTVSEEGDCFGDALGCVKSVSLTLPANGLEFVSCNGKDNSGNTAIVSEIKLIEGKEAVFPCRIKVITTQEEYTPTIKARVSYRYNLEASSMVTVIK